MKIVFKEEFESQFDDIFLFIQKGSNQRAEQFKHELLGEISKLDFMPFKWRKNLDLNDENVRDLIFKGYIIPYHVIENEIRILGIYKHNLPKIRI